MRQTAHKASLWMFLLVLALWWAPATLAQLSPGPLAQAHKELEGLRNCTQCHELGKPIDGSRCLACHTTLARRIKEGQGLHGRDSMRGKTCVSCHGDHNGRDFKLIHWEGGQGKFPHQDTGWALEGAHAKAECKDCHRQELVSPDLHGRKDLHPSRTFMGLDTACTSCHQDEHAGQLGDNCIDCHELGNWEKTRFDHGRTRFPLTGEHVRVDCAACHKPELKRPASKRFVVDAEPAQTIARFKPLAHASCTECHVDPHKGQLGSDCVSCHTTASFRGQGKSFDHASTRYPLTGAHQSVECAGCHKGTESTRLRPRHQDCDACHKDPHAGQFSRTAELRAADPRAADPRACSSCHATDSFTPSLFGVARHQEGRAPLEGAHQAVACGDCHKRNTEKDPVRFRMEGKGFAGTACTDCHQDSHDGQADAWSKEKGCLGCHDLESWSVTGFDHGLTKFALESAHAKVHCAACHTPGGTTKVRLQGVGTVCADCHQDPHRGQFIEVAASLPDCARCHTNTSWDETRFNHDASRFPLDGLHKDLPCASCHTSERDEQGEFQRFKPLGIRCEDCHGNSDKGS